VADSLKRKIGGALFAIGAIATFAAKVVDAEYDKGPNSPWPWWVWPFNAAAIACLFCGILLQAKDLRRLFAGSRSK